MKNIFKKSELATTIILVIGILVVVNFLSYQIFVRWDLTQNKDYSISKVTKEMVGNIDDIVNIKVYFSKNLPKQYITLKQEVDDLLDEYVNYSNGKVKVEFIDPDSLDNSEQELYRLGIPALQFNVLEKDKYESTKGYLGMVIQYGSKKEVIPVVENTQNFEYQVTSAIKKATSDNIGVVGILSSNGSIDLRNEAQAASKEIKELYSTQEVDLSNNTEIPDTIDTLLVIGPTEEFSEDQLKAIDSFLMKGKSILVAEDGVSVEDGLVPVVNDTKLNDLLERYGLRIKNNLILDSLSGMASFTSNFFTISTNYPFWPKINKTGFDSDNVAVSKLESVLLPWVSSIEVLPEIQNEDHKISYLIKTSDNSWTQEDNFNLDPQQQFSVNSRGSQNVAVSVSGKFTSVYSDESTDSARIIVVGDSDFLTDGFLRQSPDNLTLFQNLVDILTLDSDLINIRSKGVTSRPVKDLEDNERMMIRYLNVFGVTLIIVAYGLIRYYRRKKSKFIDEL